VFWRAGAYHPANRQLFIAAYKDAMDVQKHGGKIFLPQHLHANLEEKYRQLLTSS
jgi:hypothetical protein